MTEERKPTKLEIQKLRTSQRRMVIVRALGLDPEMSARDVADFLGLDYSKPGVQKMIKSDLIYIRNKMSEAITEHDIVPIVAKQLLTVNELRRILMDDLRRQHEREPLTLTEEYEGNNPDGPVNYRRVTQRDERVNPNTVKAVLDCLRLEREMLSVNKLYGAMVDEYLDSIRGGEETTKRSLTIQVVPGAKPELVNGEVVDEDGDG